MEKKILKWNPWWIEKKIPEQKTGIIREEHLNNLIKLLRSKEIISLTGVRRSGKSTLMYQLIRHLLKEIPAENIFYFNFDDTTKKEDADFIEEIFNKFIELKIPKGRKFVFFDELQNIPGWEKWLKKSYDFFGKDVKFIITGSNNSMLCSNLSKLLTGRIIVERIFPLSFIEILKFNDIKEDSDEETLKHFFSRYLNEGGFPEVALETDPEINNKRLKEYFDSILLRDVILTNDIRESSKMIDLAHFTLTNISKPYSYNNISKTLNININTVKEYLLFLETAFLIFQLRFFSYSVKESLFIQKQRKIFCIDNGLRNAVSFKFSRDEGRLAENLVFIELKRRDKEIFYWTNKGEVDFVIKNKDQSLSLINVCYSNDVDKREISSLLEFKKEFKNTKELIILTKDIEKKEKNIRFIPLWKWFLGRN